MRLGRLLAGLLPDEPAVLGLLALMLLTDARRPTRLDDDALPVLLADQDRRRWRHEQIKEGVILVGEGLRRTPGRPDPYVVQAAIAACHCLAPSYAATDWDAVVSWHDVLLTVHDTPVTRLNRAVAVGERDGPAAAWPGSTRSAAWPATRCGTPPGPSCSTGSAGPARPSPPTGRPSTWAPTRPSAATWRPG